MTRAARLFCLLCLLTNELQADDPPPFSYTLPPGYSNAQTATDPNRPQPETKAGELRNYSTLHSLGFEWDIEGDSNHNATCRIQYSRSDEQQWHEAMPLFRIDFAGWYASTKADRPYNMLAGSILFLRPGTEYRVKLSLVDPDGGSVNQELTMRTRPVPEVGSAGRTLHVVPASQEKIQTVADGSATNPFRGIASADAQAKPGDVFLLHAGHYGDETFRQSGVAPQDTTGAQARYIMWKAAGDGPAVFLQANIEADYLWLEGLQFQHTGEMKPALRATGKSTGVVLRANQFRGYNYSIRLNPTARGWYIADNDIVGDKPTGIEGEGIELAKSPDHTVCFNRISHTADGVSYPLRNCDIFANEIFDVSDDAIEPDYGYANVRIWGNRLHGPMGITFQPMYCGPWYIVRNQVLATAYTFKLRVLDRFLMANNTFVSWGRGGMATHAHTMLGAMSRNNLWIFAGGGASIWNTNILTDDKNREYSRKYVIYNTLKADWRTDMDYDGFDASLCDKHSREPAPKPFRWHSHRMENTTELFQFVGIEKHGKFIDRNKTFESYDLPTTPIVAKPLFTLKPDGEAVDAGVPLPNIAEEFSGKSPDLGFLEAQSPKPHFGPRNGNLKQSHEAWVLKHQR